MRLGFTGDVMLGRLANEVIHHHGFLYPFGDFLPILKSHDFNLINLETTLTTSHKKVPKVFNFKANPDKVRCLQEANISVVNLANNHILDYSEEGMLETLETLRNAKIPYIGVGQNIEEASQALIYPTEKLTLGLIGCTDNESDWLATNTRPGTHYIEIGNDQSTNRLFESIQKTRPIVDLLIVSLHWGPNNRETPLHAHQALAHAMIEQGVDIVHGHSAHVTQGVELYQNKLILYDTGDFVDDYMVGPYLRNDYTFLFQVEVNLLEKGQATIASLTLIPGLISNCQVNLAPASEYRKILSRMELLSQAFGTRFEEREGKLILMNR